MELKVKNLSVLSGKEQIVKNISFSLNENEIVALVGPSGAGKSTILRSLNRLADKESGLKVEGEVLYDGKNIFTSYSLNELRRKIGLVFQKPCVFPGSIYKNVLFGIRHHKSLKKSEADDLVESMLKKSHLWREVKDRIYKSANILSLGQKQRLAFARTLATDPDILLLDEPTSSLDPYSTHEIEQVLLELKQNKSILLVTHLLQQGKRISDRVLFISSSNGPGEIVEEGTVSEIFDNPKNNETKIYFQNS